MKQNEISKINSMTLPEKFVLLYIISSFTKNKIW